MSPGWFGLQRGSEAEQRQGARGWGRRGGRGGRLELHTAVQAMRQRKKLAGCGNKMG